MFAKLYGRTKDREALKSVLDGVTDDLKKVGSAVSAEDRRLLEEHAAFVREMEKELKEAETQDVGHAVPELEPGVKAENDNIPRISKMQIDLMINAFLGDFTRVATLQFTNSVGQARMRWLGITEGQHDLSHKPDKDTDAQEKLTKLWVDRCLQHLGERPAMAAE